ncbi:MAG TPA: class I SAM-dependent methyltransferase [Verrucomicrobiae bacterium]|nr:class I SAM-dependent methyltransferase [Verrucomicrobiae bacterium]
MERIVQPEILDTILPDDSRSPKLRRDLARINFWMGNHRTIRIALKKQFGARAPKKIVELGAGEGKLLLSIAKSSNWNNVDATLVDRNKIVAPETLAEFLRRGWRAEILTADVFDWAQNEVTDAVIANLILHHFESDRLADLFRRISGQTNFFIANEPHRFRCAPLFKPLFYGLGYHAITVHDATVSIQAGFAGGELSQLWPDKKNWQLAERRAGLFAHLFIAKRMP